MNYLWIENLKNELEVRFWKFLHSSFNLRKEIVFPSKMSIVFDWSDEFTEIEEISLLHWDLLTVIELKTESTNRYDIETFYIFDFNNNGGILFEFLFLECEKEIICCQKWGRNALANLFCFLLHLTGLTFFIWEMVAFHYQDDIFEGWKFILKKFDTWVKKKNTLNDQNLMSSSTI